jgi:hypothetical protein|tara:strand:- start:2176 stop:2718 length:543 start_codon:yes stop_codon:yes gene_type:complete
MDKERNTIVCIECDNTISEDRYKLGYTECLDCSTTEKYASHTVYPHKTGGYIQPMSAEQASNMKRLDRRAAGGGTRKAKGIVSDKSWDRWLDEYYNKEEDKPKRTLKPTPLPIYIPIREAMREVIDKYESRGYEAAYELTQSLYTTDKISLSDKSKITNELTSFEVLTTKQRKFMSFKKY